MSRTPSHSAAERAALADALSAAGPDAPTLCAGWQARELAAHLVVRERRPDASLGALLPPLRGWGERVRDGYTRMPFDELVELVRTGPPPTSPYALPGVDARVNLVEHFVHGEDVRRATDQWQPRVLPPGLQRALWRAMSFARLYYRRSPVGVVLRLPGGERKVVIAKQPSVTLTGDPGEHVLYATGRGGHARIDVEGPDEALREFGRLRLRV